jgi:hypothetical protein
MTLNRRLETAAAATVHRIRIRRRPRVFLADSPFKSTSRGLSAIMARKKREVQWEGERELELLGGRE